MNADVVAHLAHLAAHGAHFFEQFELLRGVTWIMAQNGGRDRD